MKNIFKNQPNKPLNEKQDGLLWVHTQSFYKESYYLQVRMVLINEDVSMIHKWVNMVYSKKYWKMEGSLQDLKSYYDQLTKIHPVQLFFVCYRGTPIAQFETYQVLYSEVAPHYKAGKKDYGIHLLLAPPKELIKLETPRLKHLSVNTLKTIFGFMFHSGHVERIICEPDIENLQAIQLAEKSGFTFLKAIQLKEKKAKLYMITKDQYEKDQHL